MDEHEKKIYEHDSSLYKEIKPHVNLIPDLRPQETIRRMKGEYVHGEFIPEPQNNWKMIYDELVALGYREEYEEILQTINSGNVDLILPYIENREIIREFFITYPALTWLMYHVSSKETIKPLFISQGCDLPEHLFDLLDLDTITFSDIQYIRDEETASYLYERNPTMPNVELSNFPQFIRENKKGYVYWALQNPNVDIDDFNQYVMLNFAYNGHIDLLKLFLGNPRSSAHNFMLYGAIMGNQIETVKFLLLDPRITIRKGHIDQIIGAVEDKDNEMIKLLLSYPDIKNVDLALVLEAAINARNEEIAEILINHPLVHVNDRIMRTIRGVKTLGNEYANLVEMLEKHPKIQNRL